MIFTADDLPRLAKVWISQEKLFYLDWEDTMRDVKKVAGLDSRCTSNSRWAVKNDIFKHIESDFTY